MTTHATVKTVKKLHNIIIDLLFPPACVGCDNFGPWLCDDCLKNIGAPIETCIFCNEKTLHGLTCGDVPGLEIQETGDDLDIVLDPVMNLP